MKVLFVATASLGLQADQAVMCDQLRAFALQRQIDLEIQAIRVDATQQPQHIVLQGSGLGIHPDQDAIFFMERIYSFDLPFAKAKRILVPNPILVNKATASLLATIDFFWHKTYYSLSRFRMLLPEMSHKYLGFTSRDPNALVADYMTFAQFRGKARGRHSDELLRVWRRHPDWPMFKYQFYQEGADAFSFDEWLVCRNVAILTGRLNWDRYIPELAQAGFHLCTSGSEGFGHYINEARAMAAIPVVLNAPPMNELVDEECGIHVQCTNFIDIGAGHHFLTTEEELEKAIVRALKMTEAERRDMGKKSRARFLSDRAEFQANIDALFEELVLEKSL